MTELASRHRRPPPVSPPLHPYPAISVSSAPIVAGHADAEHLRLLQPRPAGTSTPLITVPQPFHMIHSVPRLITEAPISHADMVEFLPQHRVIMPRRLTWVALMSWLFGTCVLILVLIPTAAIPKLMGPFKQPVSASGFGPLIAIFAIVAILIALGGGAWIWAAMGHEYSNSPDIQNEQD